MLHKVTVLIRHSNHTKNGLMAIAVVYQHRPHRKWIDLFADLKSNLNYAHTAIAVYESNPAFVAIASNISVGKRIFAAIENYANEHPVVCHTVLRGNHA